MKSLCHSILKPLRVANPFGLAVLTLCFVGCKKSETNPPAPAAAQPSATQPAASSAQPAVPAAPTGPVPSFSAAQKVGLYAYPAKGQSHDQQLIDESDCYNSAQQQTGINPEMSAPKPPTSADVQAAQEQAASSAPGNQRVRPGPLGEIRYPMRGDSYACFFDY